MNEMDEESLRMSERRRGSCLDAFLVVSILFLLVAVTAGAAVGVVVVMQLQSRLPPGTPSFLWVTSKNASDPPHQIYKVQNFVSLDAKISELKTSVMQWAPAEEGTLTSVGDNFLFDQEEHSLKPTRAGAYFIYIDLNLTCTFKCAAGLLSVRVGEKLTCEVQLPEMNDTFTPVTRKCWTVSQLNGQKLVTQMTVPEHGLEYWKLELIGSRFGMFKVD